MNIELKKISFNERMSEETNCFVADLYIDGKRVGICKNDGHGGCTDYHGNTKEDYAIIAKAEEYCKTLPKEKMFGREFDVTLEDLIDKKFEEYMKAKLKAKADKKMLKLQQTSIIIGVPNADIFSYFKLKQELSVYAKSNLKRFQEYIDKIKREHCTDGVVILNTNLAELGVTL